jgi:hypothetical protein
MNHVAFYGYLRLSNHHPTPTKCHAKQLHRRKSSMGLVKVMGLFCGNKFAAFKFVPSVGFDFLAVNFGSFYAKHIVI